MAERTESGNGKSMAEQNDQDQRIESAVVAADGTISIPHSAADLKSVDVADVDLLLGFADGSFVIIPNGALAAIGESEHPVVFIAGEDRADTSAQFAGDTPGTLGDLFKMVGATKIIESGNLAVVSENVESPEETADEDILGYSEENDVFADLALLSEPVVKISSGGKGPGGYQHTEPPPALSEEDPVESDITSRPSVFKAGREVENISDPLVTLDPIASDNIINSAEAGSPVNITGIVGGSAQAGGTVNLIINGALYPIAGVIQANSTFSIAVPGSLLDAVGDGNPGTVEAIVNTTGADTPGIDSKVYIVDTTAPVAPGVTLANDSSDGKLNHATDSITNDGTLNLTGIEVGATAEYSTDGGASWASTYTAPSIDGNHTVDVRQSDVAGNIGGTGSLPFILDITPPVPTIDIAANITGDGIIDDTELGTNITITGTVSGDAQPNDTVILTINGVDYYGSVDAGGTSFTVNGIPADDLAAIGNGNTGTIGARITTYDAAGNLGTAIDPAGEGYSVNITADTTPPTATIVVDDTALKIGDSATVTITFSEAVTGFSNTDLDLSGANGTLTPVSTADGGITWTATLTPDAPVEDPTNVITLADAGVVDLAGNPNNGPTNSNTYAVDTIAPTVSITTPVSGGYINALEDDAPLIINGTTAGVEDGQTVTVNVGGVNYTSAVTGNAFSIIVAPANLQALPEGAVNITADVSDVAGNQAVQATAGYVYDATAPTVTITSPISDGYINALEEGSPLTINGTTTGVEDGQTVTVNVGGVAYTPTVTGNAFSITVSAADLQGLTEGTVNITANVSDVAGNQAVQATASFVHDTVAPTVTITTPVSDGYINALEDSSPLTITGTTTGVEDGKTVTVNVGGNTYNDVVIGNTFTISVPSADLQGLTEGSVNITADVSDASGNPAVQATAGYVYDATAPTVTIATPVSDGYINALEEGSPLTINGTTTGVEDGQTVTVNVGGVAYTPTVTGNAFSITVSAADLQGLTEGTVNITANVSDVAGNQAVQATASFVHDTVAPTVTITTPVSDGYINALEDNAPLTITGTTTGVEDGQTVTVNVGGVAYTPTVTGDAFSITVSPVALQALPEGAVSITANVSDIAGNPAVQATAGFVHDTGAPTVTITTPLSDGYINALEDNSPFTITGTTTGVEDGQLVTVNAGGNIYSDLVIGNTFTISVPSADLQALPEAAVNITADVSDAAGNSAVQATATFTHDTIAPTIAITTPISDGYVNDVEDGSPLDINGTTTGVEDGQTVTVNVGGTDYLTTVTSNAFTITVPPVDLQALPEGAVNITANVADAAGNPAAQATAGYTYDITAPTVSITMPISDGYLNDSEDNSPLTITGTTTGIEDGQTVTVNVGGTDYPTTVAGNTFSISVSVADLQALPEGAVSITANVSDAAGNPAVQATASYTYDITTPGTPVITGISDDTGTVGDLLTSDTTLAINGNAEANSSIEVFIDDGLGSGPVSAGTTSANATGAWSFDHTGTTLVSGNYVITAQATDSAGNAGPESVPYAITINATAPVPIINLDQNITADDIINLAESSIDVAVTGTVTGDAQVGDTVTLLISGNTYVGSVRSDYTFSINVLGSDLVNDPDSIINAGITTEVAGISGTGNDTADYTVDIIVPTMTVNVVDGTLADNNNSSQVIFTFSEVPVGFDATDITAVGGTISGLIQDLTGDPSGKTYAATFTAEDGFTGTGSVTVTGGSYSDAALNLGAPGSGTVTIDTENPTVAVDISAGSLSDGNPSSQVTFTFSEVPTDFAPADITTVGGSIGTLTPDLIGDQSGKTYTATYTANDGFTGTGSVTVTGGSYSDAALNLGASGSGTVAIDTENPTVLSVSASDSLLGEPDVGTGTFSISVDFSEAMDTAAPPQLVFNPDVSGSLTNGAGVWSNGNTTYTVTYDITDTNVNLTNITVEVTNTQDQSGNPQLSYTSSPLFTIDTITPTVLVDIVAGSLSDGNNSSQVTFTFSEVPTDFAPADIATVGGSIGILTPDLIGDPSGKTYTATYTANDGFTGTGSVTVTGGSYSDAALNLGASGSGTVAIDTENPTVAVDISAGSLSDGDNSSQVTFTFSEVPSGFEEADITTVGGTLSGFAVDSGDPTLYTATFTAEDGFSGTGSVTVTGGSYTDAASNLGVSGSGTVVIDTKDPTVAVDIIDGLLRDANTSSLVTFNFSEVPTGFAAADITTVGGTLSSFAVDSGDPTLYTATFTAEDGFTGTGSVTVTGGSYTDAALNFGVSGSGTVPIDTENPTLTISIPGTLLSDAITSSQVVFTFSEVPYNFSSADVVTVGGSIGTSLQQNTLLDSTGRTYTAIFTATDGFSGTGSVTVNPGAYFDSAVNLGSGDSRNVAIDREDPTVVVDISAGSLSDGNPSSQVTFTFSEVPTGFSAADITTVGGTISGFAVDSGDPSGKTYTATFTAEDGFTGTGSVTVTGGSYSDAALNLGVSGSGTVTIDTENPTVAVDISAGSLNDGNPSSQVTFTFSEVPTDFAPADIATVGGSIGILTQDLTGDPSGRTYTTTFTAQNNFNGTGSVTVTGGSYTDTALNLGASGSGTVAIDTENPYVVSVIANDTVLSDSNAGTDTFNITVTFSEAMNPAVTPQLDFGTDVSGSITNATGVWSNGNTRYTVTYDVIDVNVNLTNIPVGVSNAVGANGDAMELYPPGALFSIDTLNPEPIITIDPFITADGTIDIAESTSTVTITGTVGGDAQVNDWVTLTVNGNNYTGQVQAGGPPNTFSIDVSGSDLAAVGDQQTGSITASITTYDGAGNPGTAIDTGSYFVDLTNPDFTTTLYTSPEFKIDIDDVRFPGAPAGSVDSNPIGQAARDVVNGTDNGETINHNGAFSSGESQWSKRLHLDFSAFTLLTLITIDIPAGFDISGIDGFNIAGSGISRVGNTWTITPGSGGAATSADMLTNGLDLDIVYDVNDAVTTPVDFNANVTVSGDAGAMSFGVSNAMEFTWREASTEGQFTVNGQSGNQAMVLPAAGMGLEIHAAGGDDTVNAGAGHDLIYGGTGSDTIHGGTGNDTIYGEAGNDFIYGDAGNDILIGGADNDTLDGGAGTDTVSYSGAIADVTASLVTMIGGGADSGVDTFLNVENLTGGDGNDTLTGDGNANTLSGGDGNDILEGLAGSDILNGGFGTDTAIYSAGSAVNASLTTGTATVGTDTDTLIAIENLTGSAFADTLTGNAGDNILTGDGGEDLLQGMAGADFLNGGAGTDTVSYSSDGTGVSASLASNSGTGGHAQGDTFSSIENLIGGSGNDTLTGNDSNNSLAGGAGNDTLYGGLGNDILEGGAGADTLDGGADNDTASYANATDFVTASLNITHKPFLQGDAQNDTFNNIENLTGSNYHDNLFGDSNDNILTGGLGNDTIDGAAGNDTIYANQGNDTATGDIGDDLFYLSASAGNAPTSIDGGADADTVILQDLVGGAYDLTPLAGVTSNVETLDISGDGASTILTVTSADIQSMVNNSNASELTIRVDAADTLSLSLAVGETTSSATDGAHTDYTISDGGGQIALIHWEIV